MNLLTNRQLVHDIIIKPNSYNVNKYLLQKNMNILPNVNLNDTNIKYNENYWNNLKNNLEIQNYNSIYDFIEDMLEIV